MASVAPGPSGKWIDAIDADGSVCDAARRSLEARLMPVFHNLPLAAYHAQQDSEHVHRLRVSTRRAMAALKLYRDYLPRKRVRWVKKELKQIRRTAGEARDLDVLAERLTRDYGERAAPIVSKIARLRAGIQPEIVHLAERMRRDDRFVRKTAKLLDGIRCPNASEANPDSCFRHWARGQLAGMAKEFFAAEPAADADMAALHQFRIRGKALRYAIELLTAAFGPELRKADYRVIEELQERLGRINDHVTARDQLRGWSKEADAKESELYRELADHEVGNVTDELGAFREWWTKERAERLSGDLIQCAEDSD